MIDWNPWICVHCKSAIGNPSGCRDKAIACSACQRLYPLVAPETPILVRDPEQTITDSYFTLLRQTRAMGARAAAFVQESGSVRSETVKLVQDALTHNLQLLRTLQYQLLSVLPMDRQADISKRVAVQERRSLPSRAIRAFKRFSGSAAAELSAREARTSIGYMLEILEYVRRDWSGSPLAEQRISRVEDTVLTAIRDHATDRTSVLVLGAGMARFAWDLRSLFQHVIAAEASILAAMLHDKLRQSEVSFYEINEQSAYSASDQACKTVASISKRIPTSTGSDGDLVFCVTDARSLPLADRSMSALVSIYFTDVLPLSVLLPEVKRLLMPGGLFLHFGPLDYHFADFKEKYTVEEVRGIFQKEGFEIRSECWVEDIWRTEATMRGHFTNAWCFSAVYSG